MRVITIVDMATDTRTHILDNSICMDWMVGTDVRGPTKHSPGKKYRSIFRKYMEKVFSLYIYQIDHHNTV
jgi:hypothetical protein